MDRLGTRRRVLRTQVTRLCRIVEQLVSNEVISDQDWDEIDYNHNKLRQINEELVALDRQIVDQTAADDLEDELRRNAEYESKIHRISRVKQRLAERQGPNSVQEPSTSHQHSTIVDSTASCSSNNPVFKTTTNFNMAANEYDDYTEDHSAADGTVTIRNPHIDSMAVDVLYHLSLSTGTHDLVEMFSDVKFVVMGGTPERMEAFAYYFMNELNQKLPTGTTLQDISRLSHRYSMFKVGPLLSVSHGIGIPSISIILKEVIKIMYHAHVKDPIFFRLGTCGGIGVDGGDLIITETAVDGNLNPYLELTVLGKPLRRPSVLDKRLVEELKACSNYDEDGYNTYIGKTMCANDFYEGQARLDGPFCDYTEADKMKFLHQIMEAGVINMEMESLAFAALCTHAGIKGAVICVALLNRLNGDDQITASHELMAKWKMRPMCLATKYMKEKLSQSNDKCVII